MHWAARLLVFSGLIFIGTGCHTARKVAETSFRVVDAPAHYIRERIDSSDQPETTTTTTTTTSDVANPGYPVTPTPPPTRSRVTAESQRTTSPPSAARSSSPTFDLKRRPSTSASPKAPATTQFPTARPVPGKPGYVYSIDPNGGMIDVTGYKSGDKAKDPYTKQIFIVP